ncbi:hypothetical protein FQN53_003453 [Emmonsiellopsis sp. PD_33]|nr:hypothetical protein FQN53_003453 [Emmonsiellopsis sp. PD_33]
MSSLVEIDALEATVIIDNELDVMSPPAPGTVEVSGLFGHVAMRSPYHPQDRAEASRELHLEDTAIKGDERRSMLFDVGPTESSWEENAKRLGLDLSRVERIHLSHWHRDHSGGMLKTIQMIKEAKKVKEESNQDLVVDLHPSRPDYRGFRMGPETISLQADPSFEEIEAAGAKVEKHSSAHTVLDNMFLISGEIPRVTDYETGLKYAIRFNKATGEWHEDEAITDERLLACNIKGKLLTSFSESIRGKGIVIFSGCSHAGIVNASRHVVELIGQDVPVHAIFGGYHLATSEKDQIDATVRDLKALDPKVLLPGHCSGWRVKYEIEKEMPGRLVPSSVGVTVGF